MIELSLLTLLTNMAPVYCRMRGEGYDHTKSALIAYSRMHDRYSRAQIEKSIKNGIGLKEVAIATAMIHCPNQVLKND
jgi:hypothetical protein